MWNSKPNHSLVGFGSQFVDKRKDAVEFVSYHTVEIRVYCKIPYLRVSENTSLIITLLKTVASTEYGLEFLVFDFNAFLVNLLRRQDNNVFPPAEF